MKSRRINWLAITGQIGSVLVLLALLRPVAMETGATWGNLPGKRELVESWEDLGFKYKTDHRDDPEYDSGTFSFGAHSIRADIVSRYSVRAAVRDEKRLKEEVLELRDAGKMVSMRRTGNIITVLTSDTSSREIDHAVSGLTEVIHEHILAECEVAYAPYVVLLSDSAPRVTPNWLKNLVNFLL